MTFQLYYILRASFIYSLFLVVSQPVSAQITLLSECINGGISGDGYAAWSSEGKSTVRLNIPENCTIYKAYFFSNLYSGEKVDNSPFTKTILFENQPYQLSGKNSLNNTFYMIAQELYITTIVQDISAYIHPGQSVYTIDPKPDSLSPFEKQLFSDFYVLVLYENPDFPVTCVSVYANQEDTAPDVSYQLTPVNSLIPGTPVGLSVHASSICDQQEDWYAVDVNYNYIGSIGGKEDNTHMYCAGVVGSFNHQRNLFTGIRNDTGDSLMNKLDAIADIRSYLSAQNDSLHIRFHYSGDFSPYSNVINQLFLTTSSNCKVNTNATATNNINACQGTTVKLQASGGNTYEWFPANGLDNPNSASPAFKADSNCLFTVKISQKDQCSVILPVFIHVSALPDWEQINANQANCGEPTGEISITPKPKSQKLNIFLNDSLIGNMYNNFSQINGLVAGNYMLYLKDSLGCKSRDTLIIIRDTIRTHAAFAIEPESGNVPFIFNLKDQSENAENIHYQLIINNQTKQLEENSITEGGNYTLQQIAWKNNTSCSDTAQLEFIVYDSLRVQLSEICQSDADSTGFTLTLYIPEHVYGKIQVQDESGIGFYTYSGNFNQGVHELKVFSSSCKKITASTCQVCGEFTLTKTVNYIINDTQTLKQSITFLHP